MAARDLCCFQAEREKPATSLFPLQEHSRRALFMAQGLEKLGARVTYPGLPSHPSHELFKTLGNEGFGFGGLLGLEFETADLGKAFMQVSRSPGVILK